MPRYVIERAIPEVGTFERDQLRDAAQASNSVLAAMKAEGKNIQWEHSYVAGDKTFCIYIADNEGLIAEHAERSGRLSGHIDRLALACLEIQVGNSTLALDRRRVVVSVPVEHLVVNRSRASSSQP